MSLQVSFASLLSNQAQVLPSLSYLSSLFKQRHRQTKHSQKSHSSQVVCHDSRDWLEISLESAQQSALQLFTSNSSFVNFDKLFHNSDCFSSLTKRICDNITADLFAQLRKNNSFPDILDHNSRCTSKYIYNSHKDSISINNNSFKLLNARSQLYLISQRNYNTKHHYTGIGSLNKQYAENRKNFNLKLGNFFRKDAKANPSENDKIKNLLSDESLSNEEKQRLKIAFAEGYGAAEPKSGSKRMRAFNILRDVVAVGMVIALLVSFSGGYFRRVFIGEGNEVTQEDIDVTFEDVMGVEEAKQELQEIVEFLKNPEKFSTLGGKLPKGVLLVGPPGTGKTLLARAVAGEAGVPFFHVAGPEFDEILVGQGARRVRDLFATAKKKAPCVIFIDEIDSVGSKRTNSVLHPYANQTINQLLTEMDGFRQNEGVIVLGATNRRDDLDRALIRPGRFDVEIQVPLPDYEGRKQILKLYMSKIKYSASVDLDVLARGTTGFTGADLENMVNQAALRAAIDGLQSVTMQYLENSRDKVLMGPEKKSRIPDEEANRITAYHEAGHALVAHYTKDSHPLHKVTIIPRGPSLGHTAYIPEKEAYHVTRSQMQATLDTLMGGRVAEELIFGFEKVTTGASDDLKKATGIATSMVKDYGMSDKVGVRTFDDDHSSLVVVNELSNNTSEMIDTEIKRILQESYERAKNILKTHNVQHNKLAEALLTQETLNAEEVKLLLAN